MRLNYQKEYQLREAVNRVIDQSLLTSKIVYPRPETIVELLWQEGIEVNKPYVIRRYAEKGITYENGLWVKAVE